MSKEQRQKHARIDAEPSQPGQRKATEMAAPLAGGRLSGALGHGHLAIADGTDMRRPARFDQGRSDPRPGRCGDPATSVCRVAPGASPR